MSVELLLKHSLKPIIHMILMLLWRVSVMILKPIECRLKSRQ